MFFLKKAIKLSSQPPQYIKKNSQNMLKKETKAAKKNTWGKLQCFKEKNKKTKFSTSLIVKKIKSTKIILKKNKTKKKKICKKWQFWKKKEKQIKTIKKTCGES